MTREGHDEKKFGLLGHPLKHSLSPYIHERIMSDCGIKGTYDLFQVAPEDFESKAGDILDQLDGCNVTIPYKEKIIRFLKRTEGEAGTFMTVNTVSQGLGYSTDVDGLLASGIPFEGSNMLILGAGGAARAVALAAKDSGCRTIGIWSRRSEQAEELKRKFYGSGTLEEIFVEPSAEVLPEKTVLFGKTGRYYDLIVNATPAGMWPECGDCPVSKEMIISAGYVFDTIYNPLATRLVLTARSFGVKAGSGLDMLIAQAAASQKIWNPGADLTGFSSLKLKQSLKYKMLELFPVKIVLTGFMGSGKTTTGRALAKALGIGFKDLDLVIENEYGMTVSEIFRDHGEAFFRSSESRLLQQIMKENDSLVVATGGGALLNKVNLDLVKANRGFVFFLDVDLGIISQRISGDPGRPLLITKTYEETRQLYTERMPLYRYAADHTVHASKDTSDVVADIKAALGF